jgi:hypothetical protein
LNHLAPNAGFFTGDLVSYATLKHVGVVVGVYAFFSTQRP